MPFYDASPVSKGPLINISINTALCYQDTLSGARESELTEPRIEYIP